jgi:hypothetical protein
MYVLRYVCMYVGMYVSMITLDDEMFITIDPA